MSTARRILLLLPFAPRSDADHGGGQVVAQVVRRTARRHRLAILHIAHGDAPPADPEVVRDVELVEEIRIPAATGASRHRRRARRALSLASGTPMWVDAVRSPALASRARGLTEAWRPEILRLEFSAMARYGGAVGRTRGAARVLVDYDPAVDAPIPPPAGGAVGPRTLAALDARARHRYQRSVARYVEAIVVLTADDRRALARVLPSCPISSIPLGIDVPAAAADPAGRAATLLFVGSFAHPPNVDAAHRLVTEIMPRVHDARPDAILWIVGDAPPESLRTLAEDRDEIRITGRVPDVRPYLDEAAVVLAPLRTGAGMRVKVLSALAAGKAVVASPLAVAGIDVLDGHHILVRTGDAEFARAVVELLGDPSRRAEMAGAARTWSLAHLRWDAWDAAFDALYSQLLADSGTSPADDRARKG